MQALPYIFVLASTTLVASALAGYAWRQRRVVGAAALAVLALSVAIWVFFYAIELGAPDPWAKIISAKLQYLGIVGTPLAWLIFARQFALQQRWPTHRALAALLVIPLITIGLVWTNELHGLVWRSVELAPAGGYPALELGHGMWFWVYAAYSYILMALGSWNLLQLILHAPHRSRWQTAAVLASALAPWIGNALYLARIGPFYPLDLTPFAFAFSMVLLAWLFFRFRLLHTVPLADSALVRSMRASVTTEDTPNQVLDDRRVVVRLIVLGLLMSIAVSILDDVTRASSHLPSWLLTFLEIFLSTAAAGLALLLLWHLSNRLADALTQMRAANAALRESETYYQTIANLTTDTIYSLYIDADGRLELEWISESFERATGYSLDHLREREEWLKILHPDDLTIEQAHAAALRTGQAEVREYRIITKDGRARWVRDYARPIWDAEQRRITRILGAAQDITERKITENQLRRQNDELTALHETTLGLINRLEIDGLLESLVFRAGALLDTPHGYLYVVDADAEELVVRTGTGIFANQLGYRIKRDMGLAGRTWESGQALSIENYRAWSGRQPDLDELNLRALANVPLRAGAEFVGILGLAYVDEMRQFDPQAIALLERFAAMASLAIQNARLYTAAQQEIAQRRRTEAALRNAQTDLRAAKELAEAATRAKSDFLAQMSHDMRTPISGAIGMTELLLETQLDREQQELVEIIRTSGDTLLALINNSLNLMKIEAGKLDLEQQPYELRDCVEQAIDMVAFTAQRKGLDLAYALDAQIPDRLIGDCSQLRQILVNLLSNAVKFTNDGGIFIAADARPIAEDRREIRMSVADTGIGIPADQIEAVFAPFHQLAGPDGRREAGTGLGLAISRQLSELMGGRMWLESTLGAGSTFHFTFVAQVAAAAQAPAATTGLLAGRHMLVVDGQLQTRQALALYAQSRGMPLSATGLASEALEWARQGVAFDMAAIGLTNDDIDASVLATQLRQARSISAMPVFLLVPLGQRIEWPALHEHDIVLRKPLKLSQLDAALGRIYDRASTTVTNAPPIAQSPNPPVGATPLRILIVEDDIVNRRVALWLLQEMGHHGDSASSGASALSAIEHERHDIVLLDMQLPDLDGLEIARTIRQRWPADRQPYLIAVTANTLPGARDVCIAAGMDDYLNKPLQIENLGAALARYYGRSSAPAGHNGHEPPARFGEPMPGASAAEIGAPIDPAILVRLHELFKLQPTRLLTIFQDYCADAAQQLAAMHVAAHQQQADVLRKAAHKLKSSSAIFGATTLARLCDQLEQAIGPSSAADWQALLQLIEAEFARVKDALEREWLR